MESYDTFVIFDNVISIFAIVCNNRLFIEETYVFLQLVYCYVY
ncbi:hypothetical protein EHRUM3_05290, partial [Ehrlichia ruminantium]